ncbi:MAG: hypothetical protein ACI8Z5_002017 [Lentimonas sp.]|jgi:hypothetical protein
MWRGYSSVVCVLWAEVVEKLRRRLNNSQRKQLVKDIPYAPAWMVPIFKAIGAHPSIIKTKDPLEAN